MSKCQTPEECRKECYERIITELKTGLSRYYAEFPDRILDSRSKDAEDWSARGVQRIIKILDEYTFVARKEK